MSVRYIKHLRWYICGLLFFATTVNYFDRQTVGVLNKPILQGAIGWDEAGYGWVMFAFLTAYALMFPICGRLLDVLGVRVGMLWAVTVWSVAAMAHALASTPFGFAVARFSLGVGEAANFPASIKAVAEWFPQRQRALATGIFNSGSNVGIMLSPLIVLLAQSWGWRAAFILTGSLGFLWAIAWYALYHSPEKHPRLSPEERQIIETGRPPDTSPKQTATIPWPVLLRFRQTWAFILGKGLTDPVWWFYLYWLPAYLHKERGLSGLTAAAMLIWPYLAADVGSVGGGWLSGFLMGRGWRPGPARLVTLMTFALCMPAAMWAVVADEFWLALALISLATAAHQAWSANVFTLASDMFPPRAIGSVVGLGGMCGAIGGMFMTLIAGGMLQWLGSYKPLFFLAGGLHPIAFLIVVGFGGRDLRQAHVDEAVSEHRSPALLAVGSLMVLLGGGLIALVTLNWSAIVDTTKSLSTAAGGLTAAIMLALLGALLSYAGRSHPPKTV